ncbi:MAG: hypothetical protein O3A13_11270 [Proteobacteria bacterium]|nr:hypothetical protein [Pseudomonadota bacterium]MDA0994194.1 hypothetical protein [Pseudomonadota bacterium]
MKTQVKLTLIASGFFAIAAVAQDKGHLNVRTVVQKEEVVVTDAGETKRSLVPADTVVPGDDVVYTITFTNISSEAADNVVITNPISENLTYVEGSAFGPGTVIEFSVDNGQSFAAPEALMVAVDDEVRPAEPEDFTHVRWTMQSELQSGAQGMARFKARLN